MIVLIEWPGSFFSFLGSCRKNGNGYVDIMLPMLGPSEEEVHWKKSRELKRASGDRRGIKLVVTPQLSRPEAVKKLAVRIPGSGADFLVAITQSPDEEICLGEVASWNNQRLCFLRRIEERKVPPRYQFH